MLFATVVAFLTERRLLRGRKQPKANVRKQSTITITNGLSRICPSGLYANQYVSLADTSYQYFHHVLKKKNLEKYIKSYPERGRWKKYQGTQLGDIY